MSVKFYRCRHCGNVIQKVVDSKVPVVCCGEKMEELVPGTVDASLEKHVPFVTRIDENTLRIQVGSVEHPMLPEHHIEWILLETKKGFQIKYLEPGDAPEAKFILSDDEAVAAYEYCNLHGLWKKEL